MTGTPYGSFSWRLALCTGTEAMAALVGVIGSSAAVAPPTRQKEVVAGGRSSRYAGGHVHGRGRAFRVADSGEVGGACTCLLFPLLLPRRSHVTEYAVPRVAKASHAVVQVERLLCA